MVDGFNLLKDIIIEKMREANGSLRIFTTSEFV